jgi:hypothetical protein
VKKSTPVEFIYLLSVLIAFIIGYVSCVVVDRTTQDRPDAIIVYEGSDEDRPMYTVTLPSGKKLENMYAEEIAQGLMDGKWEFNQDLTIAFTSEYQLTLEPDSLVIYNGPRKVAMVHYDQTGILDSIFIADNQ